jgi:hypothetical protein
MDPFLQQKMIRITKMLTPISMIQLLDKAVLLGNLLIRRLLRHFIPRNDTEFIERITRLTFNAAHFLWPAIGLIAVSIRIFLLLTMLKLILCLHIGKKISDCF